MKDFFLISAPKPECTKDPQCPLDLACIQQTCQDPCTKLTCGVNAECKVYNHRAVCSCKRGYEGDPYSFCEERKSDIFMPQSKAATNHFLFLQRDVRATLNVKMTKPASAGSVKTHASLKSAVETPSVRLRTTGPNASAWRTTRVIPTLLAASHMSVLWIQTATQLWPVAMKSVLIRANVPSMLTAALGTTEATAHAARVTLVILTDMPAPKVGGNSSCIIQEGQS